MFFEINAHALESVSGEERDQAWVLFFELISDVFEGLPHSVFDHLFFGLFDFFESFVEVIKDLNQKWWPSLFQFLFDFGDTLFVKVDAINKELDHVSR